MMMSRMRAMAHLGLAGLFAAAAALLSAPAQAAVRAASAHVYLLSGVLSMSPGLDELAEMIRRHGIAASIDNHTRWSAVADDAIAQYKRGRLRSIVIIGHSAGGGAALDMAGELERAGVPVALVVAIDPTGTSTVPENVRRTVDVYVAGGLGSALTGAGRMHGAIVNLRDNSPSVGHFSIIAAHERQLLGYVLGSIGSRAAAVKARADAAQARTARASSSAD